MDKKFDEKRLIEFTTGIVIGTITNVFASKKLADKDPADKKIIKTVMAIGLSSAAQLIINKIYD